MKTFLTCILFSLSWVAYAATPVQSVASSQSLEVVAHTDKQIYAPGERVVMTLSVTNPTESAVVLDFASGQRFDFGVSDVDGKALWTWSANKNFIAAMGSEVIEAGASLTYEVDEYVVSREGVFALEARLTSFEPLATDVFFAVDSTPLSVDGFWVGEATQAVPGLAPMQSWEGVLWNHRLYGEWRNSTGQQGWFRAERLLATGGGDPVFEGTWVTSGADPLSGRFQLEFSATEGTCTGSGGVNGMDSVIFELSGGKGLHTQSLGDAEPN